MRYNKFTRYDSVLYQGRPCVVEDTWSIGRDWYVAVRPVREAGTYFLSQDFVSLDNSTPVSAFTAV